MNNSDFDWLYGKDREDKRDEDTRVFSDEEVARISQEDAPQQQPRAHEPRQPVNPPQYGSAPPHAPQQPMRPGPQQPPRGRQQKRRRRRRRRPFLRFVGFLVVLWLVFLIGTPIYAWTAGTSLDAMPDGDRPAEQPGSAVLLVGSDGRDDLTAEDRARLGTGQVEGNRADTMMLLYKPPSGRSVVMSFPRDSYVEIPGQGMGKLNAAYAWGGPELAVQTIEHNTGIRIDGYLEVGFLGVVDSVDAVGGIEICPEQAIQDNDSHLDLPAGCQEIDGVTALNYARMRKADPRGDLGRVERQREVVGKVMSKALSPMTFINPVRYWRVNMAVSSSLARSEGFGVSNMFAAGTAFAGAAFGSGISMTVPISGTPNIGGQSVVQWDEGASREVFDAIISGDTEPLGKYEQ